MGNGCEFVRGEPVTWPNVRRAKRRARGATARRAAAANARPPRPGSPSARPPGAAPRRGPGMPTACASWGGAWAAPRRSCTAGPAARTGPSETGPGRSPRSRPGPQRTCGRRPTPGGSARRATPRACRWSASSPCCSRKNGSRPSSGRAKRRKKSISGEIGWNAKDCSAFVWRNDTCWTCSGG